MTSSINMLLVSSAPVFLLQNPGSPKFAACVPIPASTSFRAAGIPSSENPLQEPHQKACDKLLGAKTSFRSIPAAFIDFLQTVLHVSYQAPSNMDKCRIFSIQNSYGYCAGKDVFWTLQNRKSMQSLVQKQKWILPDVTNLLNDH